MPRAHLRRRGVPRNGESVPCARTLSHYALRMADIANHLLAWIYAKGVNMDLCRGASTPSKHRTLMPVVEFNKLER